MKYRVEVKKLNAADFGEATSRIRLFVIARAGRRPINWPKPTHAKDGKDGLLPWRPAAEIIDWTLACPSIFERKKSLADKTLKRIEIGIKKYCRPDDVERFLVKLYGSNTVASAEAPLPTVTAKGNHLGIVNPFLLPRVGIYDRGTGEKRGTVCTNNGKALAAPFILPHAGSGYTGEPGRSKDTRSLEEPVPTILATDKSMHNLVMPFLTTYHNGPDGANRNSSLGDPVPTLDTSNRHAVVSPFIVPNFGERDGQQPRTHGVDKPLPAVTSHGAGAVVTPFIVNNRGKSDASSIENPLPTLTAKGQKSLAFPFMVDTNHGDKGSNDGGRVHSTDKPLGTVSTHNGKAVCKAFLTNYFGTGGADPIEEPLSTLTTKARHGLAAAMFDDATEEIKINHASPAMNSLLQTMVEYNIADIGFRMLAVSELLAAQGFPNNYNLHGTKAEMTKQIGNSVCVRVAKAICEALVA